VVLGQFHSYLGERTALGFTVSEYRRLWAWEGEHIRG
jgi:hypothetical protein